MGDERAAPEEELERILLNRNGTPARNLHFVEWQEDISDPTDEFMATSRRVIRIQVQQNDVWIPRPLSNGSPMMDDDSGVGLLSLLRHSPPKDGAESAMRHWRAFWITPLLTEVTSAGPYRFEVETHDAFGKPTVCQSAPFILTTDEGRPLAHKCVRRATVVE